MVARARVVVWALLACAACSSAKIKATNSDAGVAGSDAGDASAKANETLSLFDAARITSDMSAPNFQTLNADVDFGGGPFASATLIADLGTTCFPFDTWANDAPPIGQNWPADCDSFDRNFELSLDNATDDAAAVPGLELVRAITPFGGPMHIERDLTAIANAQPGSHQLRAWISTYADGTGQVTGSNAGWNVSARIELVRGPAPEQPLAVVPLFYGELTTTDPVSASFTTPEGTSRAYLEYRTTGHGQAAGDAFQCVGPAEEFCKRTHTVSLDGVELKRFIPWVSCVNDCTLTTTAGDAGISYCSENPCGAVASVQAPRANWCPGAESAPIVLDAAELATPGTHQVSWQVSRIATGGNVRVSVTYYAFAD